MIKKYVWIVMSCLLATSASAQWALPQETVQDIRQSLKEELTLTPYMTLMTAISVGDFARVDEILTQYPQLVNKNINKNGQDFPIVYDIFLQGDESILDVFYKHGAECKECLNKSLVGDLTPIKELTLKHQLPIYGVYYKDLVKLPNWKEAYLPLAKEVRVDLDKLDELVFETINKENASNLLDKVRSNEPQTQQKIEDYRELLKSLYAQFAEEKPQLPSMELPQISVTFLDKTYEPKNSGEVDQMIENIRNAYQNEVETKYIAYGETVPSDLAVQRDRAIAQLNRAVSQLVEYEQRIQEQNNINSYNDKERLATNNKIAQAVKLFKGQMDLVPLFFEHFPNENGENWEYYPTGGELMGIDFHIPVLYNTITWVAYDARPEAFGTYLHYKILGEIKDAKDVKRALKILAPDTACFNIVEAVFQDPENPKILYVIFHDEGLGEWGQSTTWYYFLNLMVVEEGKCKRLKNENSPHLGNRDGRIRSWKKELKEKGYTLIWEAK